MSTKKYGLGAAMLLLVLCSLASATLVNESLPPYLGRQTIQGVCPDDRILEVGPNGIVNFVEGGSHANPEDDRPRVDMGSTAEQTCTIIMSGGILNIAVGFEDAGLEVTDNNDTLPERVYVNSGTMTCSRVHILANRNGKIIVGGGTLIINQYFGDGDDQWDPNEWVKPGDGRLEAAEGYELVLEAPAPGGPEGSVKITAVRSASNPNPADNSTITDLNLANLCWDSLDAKIYKVYFGQTDANEGDYLTDPDMDYLGESAEDPDPNAPAQNLCYSLAGLTPLAVPATFTWALEAYADVNDVTGEPDGLFDVKVYHFFTSSIPVIITQPQTVAVDFGGTAVLSTVVQSITPLTSWDWYQLVGGVYVVSPVGTTVKTDLGGSQYQITLTVTGIDTAGEQGRFLCRPTNSAGSVDTNIVNIVSKAMLAHWDFNNNLNDTAPKNAINATVYNATAAVTPVYDTGHNLDPNSLNFDGTNQWLDLPDGFGNFQAGMTIAANFRVDSPSETGRWARLVEFVRDVVPATEPDATIVSLFRDDNTYDEMWFRTLGGATPSEVNPNGIHDGGVWTYSVLTMDQNGLVRFYRNGFEGNNLGQNSPVGTVTLPTQIGRTNNRIGWDWAGSVAKLNGRIGDLRIYNYPLTIDEVRTLYAEANGPFCVTRPTLDYVQTGASNCVVDTADLLYFADRWLDCGLWPVSACQ